MSDYSKLDNEDILPFIFHPTSCVQNKLAGEYVDVDIDTGDGSTLGCRLHVAGKESPTIVYFHGNGETVPDYDSIAALYVEKGLNLFVTTYRGYGWSTGSPTVSAMLSDAQVILEVITDWLAGNGYAETLFIMGRSLGSAAAIDLVSSNAEAVKGLIIESGFAETVPLVSSLGIDVGQTDFTEDDGFRNCEKIAEIKLPTLILHGARDEIIPVARAEKLQADSGARSKQFMVIPGATHNTMIDAGGEHYFEAIKKFTDTILGKNDWRTRRRKFRQKQQG